METDKESNCANMGVAGKVYKRNDDDEVISGVTIQVTGDEDGFRGPYYGTTDSKGRYGIVIAGYGKIPERVKFTAKIYGPDTKTDDDPSWNFTKDCDSDDALQIMKINWSKRE